MNHKFKPGTLVYAGLGSYAIMHRYLYIAENQFYRLEKAKVKFVEYEIDIDKVIFLVEEKNDLKGISIWGYKENIKMVT